jgi:hypothetical protein
MKIIYFIWLGAILVWLVVLRFFYSHKIGMAVDLVFILTGWPLWLFFKRR